MKNETCAVVLAFNREKMIYKCINALTKQERAKCDILVIDNSTDADIKRGLNKLCNEIMYYKTEENLGCAGGFCLGIKKAIQAGYRYIWTLDDDVVPDKDALANLLDVASDMKGNWGILSSKVYWKDGSLCKANIQKKGIFTFMQEKDYSQTIVPAFMVSWASMFINSEAVKEVGLPIKEYFVYSDDYEFCARIQSKFKVFVVPSSKVKHEMEINQKANILNERNERLNRFRYLYRNDMHCYRQLGIKGIIYICLKDTYTLTKIIICRTDNKREKLLMVLNAIRDGLRFSPNIDYI